ncbi:hypothetical protein AQJ43_07175 [Streptomyces avermitilis]|uniref:vWA domain-containing protein n=1 Tax=Streptomyces avermitilis TaxID=33903 RepID=UPI00056681A6|nr:VWA domain-containing protein [Streptomyces avermitilis]KUN55857.1 hypothetical protein AQJ43_07175 [Streptomyces avermitilis]OOV25571.1 hypothetical protein SM007_24660 [Streptomyces avermitilis]GDY87136.1 hypothetical protein SAVCW2_63350 [Streptomyces avermitilis]
MPSDENQQNSRRNAGRPAVLYVGPPVAGDDVDRAAAEARERARGAGLAPLEEFARTAEDADALLAAHPDAVLVVHPGDAPPATPSEPGTGLWDFLRCGAVLRLCGSEAAGDAERVPLPPRRECWAFLVLDLVRPDTTTGAPYLRDPRREAECRDFAALHALSVMDVLTGDRAVWTRTSGLASVLLPVNEETLTVIVHPEITAPDADTLDGLLWRWLRRGRTIRSGRPVDRHAPGMPSARDITSEPMYERRLAADPDTVAATPDSVGRYYRDLDAPLYARASVGNRWGHARGFGDALPPPRGPFPTPRDTTQPLPHDGLYIRRNNAFGTRSALGVRDLIEQGVIIGQEQIRFDDFVADRTEQVPGPRPGEAVAVSHGLAAVPGEFKANEATTHFVEIALKAGRARPEDAPATEPLPVNFVFVVDTSGSMTGTKLDTVKSALQTIYRELRPADCLGIITFDHNVRTVLPAVAKQDLPPERFAEVVSALTTQGGTDIDLGVQYGIDEISRHSVSGRTVNCLYLFSDGDPTSGERDWIKVRANVAAKLRGDLTLSCFGFGSDARMPELAALAGLAGGHSTFVTRPEQVGADLLGDLSRRDHLAAIDIQLRLDIDPEVEIRHLYGHDLVTDPRARAAVLREAGQAAERALQDYGTKALPDIITEDKGIRIFAPDLAFEETYWVVLEIRVPAGRELSGLGTATVQYVDTVARAGRRHELDLCEALTLPEETVTVHAVGLWTSEVTFYALDDLYDRDREAAKNRLTHHLKNLEAAHSHLPAKEFRDDQVTLRKLITLTGALGAVVSFSDVSHGAGAGPGFAPAVRVMNDFGRVRSGFWPHY